MNNVKFFFVFLGLFFLFSSINVLDEQSNASIKEKSGTEQVDPSILGPSTVTPEPPKTDPPPTGGG